MRVFYEEMNETIDPILTPSTKRFVLLPIKYPEIWEAYKRNLSTFWTAEEIDLADDLRDWSKLTPDEQNFVKQVLGFFAASDGIVNENININFASEIQIPEARAFYAYQTLIESIHSETYSLLIDTFIKNEAEKTHLFNAIETIPAIKQKCEWAMKWFDSSRPFAQRIIAFACVEGIHFAGSFCAIFWLKKRGLMPGLCKSNEFIARDESEHRRFAELIYNTLQPENRASQKVIHEIVKDAVEVEKSFVCDALKVNLIGMNKELMCQYIEFVADHLLSSLGYEKLFPKSTNPFPWMDLLGLNSSKTNFFEQRVSEYSKAGIMVNPEENKFSLDDDF